MKPLTYTAARSAEDAVRSLAASGPGAAFLAGGTTLYDLMKLQVEAPTALVDIHSMPDFDAVDTSGSDELLIGAGARMADVAEDGVLLAGYPALAESLALAASQQLRNMATVGGNLLQRTRCPYFRGGAPFACNKREPGSGCAARAGNDRANAVLGTSGSCTATYPGDWAVALIAFDAVLDLLGPAGPRSLPLADLHRAPGDEPHRETTLQPGELITRIRVPVTPAGRGSTYLKVRDRESYAFALASAAAAVSLASDGTVADVRLAVGGAATRPWRDAAAEQVLLGQRLTDKALRRAGEVIFAGAVGGTDNTFKIELGIRTLMDAVRIAGRRAQQ